MRVISRLLFLVALFLPSISLADNAGHDAAINIGTEFPMSGSSRGDNLDASSTTRRNAYGFLAPETCTIDEVCVYVDSKSGSPGATDGVLAIYSDASGQPNSSLSSGTFDPGTTGYKCSTQSQAVVAGTQYWFHITNANGTPGTNYFSIWQGPQGIVPGGTSTDVQNLGSSMCRSTDNGATWSAINRVSAASYRVHCSNGRYFGFPMQGDDTPSNPIAVADRIYSTNEVGNKFTTPAGATMNLRCASFRMQKVAGTPTGFPRIRIYTGTTLTDTTSSAAVVTTFNNVAGYKLCFSSAVALAPSTTYRVVLGETTQSDTSSNAYGPHRIDWHNTSASLALKPFNGTLSKTVCASSCSGGTWTDTTTSFYLMKLWLDSGNEFGATASGGQKSGTNPGLN